MQMTTSLQCCRRVICEPKDGRPGSGLAVSRSFGDLDFKQPNRCVLFLFMGKKREEEHSTLCSVLQ